MIYRKDEIEIHFESALLIAIAPAVITSLIDGMGEWSNSRNYKKTKALEAIQSFRIHVGSKINNPRVDYYKNITKLSDLELQKMIMFLNQWSVYVTNDIASDKVITQALLYELQLCLSALEPVAKAMRLKINIDGYLQLDKYFLVDYR